MSLVKKMTPILTVESIEHCLEFWTRLGFEKTMEVPHGDRLGFVGLQRGAMELMLQSRASLGADLPALAAPGQSILYLDVDDLDCVAEQLASAEVAVPRRRTSYGADEIWFREPGGHVVGFAQFD
jgi:hypothetical protein